MAVEATALACVVVNLDEEEDEEDVEVADAAAAFTVASRMLRTAVTNVLGNGTGVSTCVATACRCASGMVGAEKKIKATYKSVTKRTGMEQTTRK